MFQRSHLPGTTRHATKRRLATLALALCALLPACGGGGDGAMTPSGPSQAQITATVTNPVLDFSSRPGFVYEMRFTLTVAESAGLGANFNFIRADFFTASGTLLERQEITASQLGRVPPSQSISAQILIGFNSDPLPGRYTVVTFNFTDDRGNNISVNVRINF